MSAWRLIPNSEFLELVGRVVMPVPNEYQTAHVSMCSYGRFVATLYKDFEWGVQELVLRDYEDRDVFWGAVRKRRGHLFLADEAGDYPQGERPQIMCLLGDMEDPWANT